MIFALNIKIAIDDVKSCCILFLNHTQKLTETKGVKRIRLVLRAYKMCHKRNEIENKKVKNRF